MTKTLFRNVARTMYGHAFRSTCWLSLLLVKSMKSVVGTTAPFLNFFWHVLKYTAFTYQTTGKRLFQTESVINFRFHHEWSTAQCLLFKSCLSILNQISHSEGKHKQTAQLSDVMKGVMNDEAHLFILYNIMRLCSCIIIICTYLNLDCCLKIILTPICIFMTWE